MRIYNINSNNFTGYDVRPLKGFLMSSNTHGIANEMQAIANQEGFKLYSAIKDIGCKKGIEQLETDFLNLWAQDYWTILKDSILGVENESTTSYIKSFFKLKDDVTTKEKCINKFKEYHIKGGNLFIINGENGDEILVGENEFDDISPNEIKERYNVKKVVALPQMDFHLDLFIRPLSNKKILLADDTLALNILKKGYNRFLNFTSTLPEAERRKYYIQDLCFENLIKDFEFYQKENSYAKKEDVEKVLKEEGFDVIKVPGRIYEFMDNHNFLHHICNYMNANVIKNRDGKLVYITNKSSVDDMLKLTPEISEKIGFSFEEEFIKSISDYVDREHIYFINGEKDFVKDRLLYDFGGGIHCLCTEIPE